MCNRHAAPTFSGESWTVEDLELFWEKIDAIGKEWGITYPRQQIELISADQMIETISTIGAPCSYDHWSIGKEALQMEEAYKKGKTGLALELVINSEPSIMYIMENNTLIQQGLVMAHAGIGHGSVYKNNYLFKEWTQPESILEYMAFAKKYVAECEVKYGETEVEHFLDICHALQNYSVSLHKRSSRKKKLAKKERLNEARYDDMDLSTTVPNFDYQEKIKRKLRKLNSSGPEFPEENVLYFLEKHTPDLPVWQKELMRINRKLMEYFYPQTKTKILHEGWATFIEYMVFNELYDRGHIDEGGYIEFLRDHANIIWQPAHDSQYFNGSINPYSIGYYIFEDLYRMTINPTEKDLREYPEICNTRWQDSLMNVVKNYIDTDFISRYLTDNVIKKMKLFSFETHRNDFRATITGTAAHYDTIRDVLAQELISFNRIPRLEIMSISPFSDRLNLNAYAVDGKKLDTESLKAIAYYIYLIWGNEVKIESVEA